MGFILFCLSLINFFQLGSKACLDQGLGLLVKVLGQFYMWFSLAHKGRFIWINFLEQFKHM
jgi:hypothetical protein